MYACLCVQRKKKFEEIWVARNHAVNFPRTFAECRYRMEEMLSKHMEAPSQVIAASRPGSRISSTIAINPKNPMKIIATIASERPLFLKRKRSNPATADMVARVSKLKSVMVSPRYALRSCGFSLRSRQYEIARRAASVMRRAQSTHASKVSAMMPTGRVCETGPNGSRSEWLSSIAATGRGRGPG